MIISSTEGRTNAEEEPVAAASATFFSEFVRLSRKRKWNSIFAYLANMNLHFLSKQFYRNQFLISDATLYWYFKVLQTKVVSIKEKNIRLDIKHLYFYL